jgi:hypothetical protein
VTTRPYSVLVLGQSFAVVFEATAGTLVKDRDRKYGETDLGAQRMTVRDDLGPDQERDTVLHEVLHALLGVGGAAGLSSDEEETVVRLLAPTMLDVLRRNPVLVRYLTERTEAGS